MNRMETTDIVIHKGEKEERYQLFVEDYVMSYLKKYQSGEDGFYFYGKRESRNKKYYIYGAGRQKDIPYFTSYELLDDITCRYVMDMPVFSIKEKTRTYELAGYNIFYQNNDAMQNYMIEQRKKAETAEKERGKQERYNSRPERKKGGGWNILQEQEKGKGRNTLQKEEKGERWNNPQKRKEEESYIEGGEQVGRRAQIRSGNGSANRPKKQKNGIMAVQLSAIFVILSAIVINSTNSFSKLSDLNQAAVEVFFAMENQEASERESVSGKRTDADGGEDVPGQETGEAEENVFSGQASDEDEGDALSGKETDEDGKDASSGHNNDTTDSTGGIVLRLEDLDAKFEEENQMAKQETEETEEQVENQENEENGNNQEVSEENRTSVADEAGESGQIGGAEKTNADSKKASEGNTTADMPSEQAFVRNFAEYYRIEKGDTLNKISVKIYGDTSKVKDICELNKITDPDNIKYGQKILLP